MGNRHPAIVPYETFQASDGEFVLAVGTDDQFRRLCQIANLPEEDRFATNRQRVTNYNALRPILADRFRTETRDHWIGQLRKAGVPSGSVRNVGELFADPQMAAREMLVDLRHASIGALQVVGTPIKLSDTPGAVRQAPPLLGEHTQAVLTRELGLAADQVDSLRAKGVV
jgi:crotonobetainyl-CoA:carnitine CoA-transferase CaiB-like acyl-CoA transferase